MRNSSLSESTPLLTGRPNWFDELDWYLDVIVSSSLLDFAHRFWNQYYKGEKQTKTLAKHSPHYLKTSFMLERMQRLQKSAVAVMNSLYNTRRLGEMNQQNLFARIEGRAKIS